MKHVLLLPFLLAMPGLAAAEIYRSVDAQGRVTFSQTPPEGQRAQRVEPRVAPANPTEVQALRKQMETIDKKRTEADKKAAEEQAKAAKRAETCKGAREYLAMLAERPANRLMSRNDKGEMVRWTEERHDEQRREAEKMAASSCGSS